MCGRFGLFAELDALAEQFNFDPAIMRNIYSLRWNIPPTVPVLTVQPSSSKGQSGENEAKLLRWGMTGARHPRSRGSSRPLFNARAETIHRLPSFRQSFRERRCLIPASGFYEWIKDDSSGRTPVWFHREDDATMAFAGIWATERTDNGDIDACAVITCAANELVAPVHHSMCRICCRSRVCIAARDTDWSSRRMRGWLGMLPCMRWMSRIYTRGRSGDGRQISSASG